MYKRENISVSRSFLYNENVDTGLAPRMHKHALLPDRHFHSLSFMTRTLAAVYGSYGMSLDSGAARFVCRLSSSQRRRCVLHSDEFAVIWWSTRITGANPVSFWANSNMATQQLYITMKQQHNSNITSHAMQTDNKHVAAIWWPTLHLQLVLHSRYLYLLRVQWTIPHNRQTLQKQWRHEAETSGGRGPG